MKITHKLKLDKTYAGKEIVWGLGAIGFGEVVLGDFRLVTSGQAASASILECSPPLSCSSPSFSTLRSHISSSAHYRTPGNKDTVIYDVYVFLLYISFLLCIICRMPLTAKCNKTHFMACKMFAGFKIM